MRASLLLILFALSFSSYSQDKYTISGYVRSAETGEELIGATVAVRSLNTGVSSNVYGFYSLTLQEGSYEVSYTYLGFQEVKKTIELNQNIELNVELKESVKELEVVEITDEADNKNISSIEMSVNKIDSKTIKKIPALLGEADVVK